MNLISLKDYAAQKGISYEAVRQQVARYRDELGDHIVRDGRQQFLDDEAVAFLDERRQKNPVVIIQQDKNERIAQLEEENKLLLQKLASVQDALLAERERTQALIADQDGKIARLEADNEAARQKVDQAERATQEAVDAVRAAEAARCAQEIEKIQQTLQGQLDAAVKVMTEERKSLEDDNHLLQQRLNQVNNRSRWQKFLDVFR